MAVKCPEVMTHDLYTRWITALRSGQYRQGFHSICSGPAGHERYCCLGVLCRVIDPMDMLGYHPSYPSMPFYDQLDRLLGGSVKQYIGLNDLYRLTFEEIAQKIEDSMRPNDENDQ